MLSSQRLAHHPATPASLARERLLRDRTLRRNRRPDATLQPLAIPSITTTFAFLAAEPCAAEARLTPAAQSLQAVQVARGFRGHYLAKMEYNQEDHTAIARLRSKHDHSGCADQKITVDAQGNVNVQRCGAGGWRAARVQRLLMLLGVGLSGVAGLLWLA
jgi:hypothetical protein